MAIEFTFKDNELIIPNLDLAHLVDKVAERDAWFMQCEPDTFDSARVRIVHGSRFFVQAQDNFMGVAIVSGEQVVGMGMAKRSPEDVEIPGRGVQIALWRAIDNAFGRLLYQASNNCP